ncbi:MAG: type II toxin-antitoxin system RelB/DinJ family antitoxin [Clostridia bacterium]|nr:type II toxin-antitoxin system RelB/DinJ family antitoxin [Clostridia bacterium]
MRKMATVRINEEIKDEVTPILNKLGISLSEAINMFLHQIKLNNGIPFDLKIKNPVELNDGYGSYICEEGHLHDYSKINLKEIEKEAKSNKTYNSAKEMINDILEEE